MLRRRLLPLFPLRARLRRPLGPVAPFARRRLRRQALRRF